ncbi:MAG: hypothetical protein ACXACR_06650 [Candidatus Hodarchaeales archaeon]
MGKSFRFLFITISIIIITFGIISSAAIYQFTMKDFWEDGGTIILENYLEVDYLGTELDLETTITTSYTFHENTSIKNLFFNSSSLYPAQNSILMQDTVIVDVGWYIFPSFELEKGDAVDYNFTLVGGKIDFVVLNNSQFNRLDPSIGFQGVQSIEQILTDSGASGTITPSSSDLYYFIWLNDPKNNQDSITINIQLDKRAPKRTKVNVIEIDPTLLNTTNSGTLTDFGMDTEDWKINDEIRIEINKRDIYFSIVKEEDLIISYNGDPEIIPCWVLEQKDYSETMLFSETFTLNASYSIWKSKFSGINLKESIFGDLFDGNSSLVATYFEKYTLTGSTNVLLIPKPTSPIIFPLLPTIIGLTTLFLFKKRNS